MVTNAVYRRPERRENRLLSVTSQSLFNERPIPLYRSRDNGTAKNHRKLRVTPMKIASMQENEIWGGEEKVVKQLETEYLRQQLGIRMLK